MKKSNEKEIYKKEIIEMVKKIENPAILRYIYIIVLGVIKEIRLDFEQEITGNK